MKQIFYLFTYLCISTTNYNTMVYDISQIAFEAGPCEGTCPIFTMTILNNGVANYDAIMFNQQKGKFKTKIKRTELDSLMMLVKSSDLFSLEDKYTTPVTCHPSYTLTVKFKNGTIKTIEDYGPSGPDELEKIYEFFFSLRNSQQWK